MMFAKLRAIEIDGCSSLKSVFPTSLAKARGGVMLEPGGSNEPPNLSNFYFILYL